MESGDRFVQRRSGKIGEEVLKSAERISGIVKIFFALCGVDAQSVFDKTIGSPARSVFTSRIERAAFVFDKGHRFARRISSAFINFFGKEGCNAIDIVHERIDIFKYVGIDTLHDIVFLFSAVVIGRKKSVVYVAASEGNARTADSGERIR